MNRKIVLAPHRYVQGPGTLSQISEHLEILGICRPLILADPNVIKACIKRMTDDLETAGIAGNFVEFGGESTWDEIARVKDACLQDTHDAIISCGGGKTLDTGRAAAAGTAINYGVVPPRKMEQVGADVSCVQVPTIASTDAPTARASLIYDAKGVFETVILVPTNPTMVLVDTEIIAKAPVRTLVAGMGDAMATRFEAEVCHRTGALTHAGGRTSRAALALARLAFDILMEFGIKAKKENEAGVPGPALEAVVEANILLSGIGYESGGLSAAHAIADSLTILGESFTTPPYHGELVSFGTLAQLLLEERPMGLVEQVIQFCRAVGLPSTLADMGIRHVSAQDLERVADAASKDPLIRSMPQASETPDAEGRFYDPGKILNCLRAAEVYGETGN